MTEPTGAVDPKRLERLLAIAFERIESDEPLELEELSEGDPALRAVLEELLGIAPALSSLQEQSVGHDPLLGRRLSDRYELLKRIGQGAMGAVYQARDHELSRDVAVKVLQRSILDSDKTAERFLREAELCAKLRHEHVVPVYDRGRTEDGLCFLVLALLQGHTLSEAVREELRGKAQDRGGDSLRRAVRLCIEVGDGLAAAHAAGITHRDVKPSNVFVDEETDRAILLDFGIATEGVQGSLTTSESTLGTPWYMAPEIASGQSRGHDEARVDVYGLGATLYHLLAGRPPYEGNGLEVIARVQQHDPEPLRSLGLPADLDAIVAKAMERDPRDRYESAQAFGDDLRAFLAHRPITARRINPVHRFLRSVRRRPIRALAVGSSIAAITLLASTASLWSDLSAREVEREYTELDRSLPALLAIEGHPDQRLSIRPEERARQRAQLDRMLELRPDDAPIRLFRAAIALDAGDRETLRDDWARLGALDDPYLTEISKRVLATGSDVRSFLLVDTRDLPAPTSEAGRLSRAFHILRGRERAAYPDAVELLDACPSLGLAKDLRLIALLGQESRATAVQTLEAAADLERDQGEASARSSFVRGAALCQLRRYEEAVAPLRTAVERRPDRHGPNHNLGLALRRIGEFDEARVYLERAHAARPWLWNTCSEMAGLEAALGHFDEAQSWAERIGTEGPALSPVRQSYELANVAMKRAFVARENDDQDTLAESVERARTLYDQVIRDAPERDRLRNKARRQLLVCNAIGMGSLSSMRSSMLRSATSAALDPTTLFNLAAAVSESPLDDDERNLLRALLLEQVCALVPSSTEYRAARDRARRLAGLPPRN